MPTLNHDLFMMLNAGADPGERIVWLLGVVAGSPMVLCPALLVGLWIWGRPDARGALLAIAAAVVLGQGINLLLGQMWFEPRPFMIGVGHTLVPHAADNSFPSDHATFVFGLAFGLIATGASRRWGLVMCLFGVAIAWVRVYLGVHFPIDMLTAAMVGAVVSQIARLTTPVARAWVLPPLEAIYEGAVQLLRLPPGLIPRRQPGAR